MSPEELEYRAAHRAMVETKPITREVLVRYGRALNQEIMRRQTIMREAEMEHKRPTEELIARYDAVVHMLSFFPLEQS